MYKLHGEVGLWSEASIHRAGFIDLSDAGMLQPTKRLRFHFEASHQLRVRHAGLDDLEGHRSTGLALLSFIDDTHTTFTDKTEHSIPADGGREIWLYPGLKTVSASTRRLKTQFEHAARAAPAEHTGLRHRTSTSLASA
jgi:hypothetical protein